ncbi:amidase [Wenzhouxiangella sp. AB-CW3]|uniref:amidase n=1 Tax=Wenzhouxiangella sp. AB-CW3 TaxID=2771012 RepID=UPI00168A47E3|nr:amidase [Wenzhouxiangella sp. AB-CW3]QOC22861.1 amidase [Wenzhouxiangella sp. AB-CW3]
MPRKILFAFLFLSTGLQAGDLPDVAELSVADLQRGYEEGDFTIVDVTRAYLTRIEAYDRNGPRLNSVLTVSDDALETAEALDRELAAGEHRGPLHGIPVLLKDNIDTHDMPTTAGSVFLAESVPPKDAFIVKRLREAGAIILGKTNLSEWANFHSSFSSSGWSRLGGQVRNPYDPDRNPCGSSSGSGVAAAAGLAAVTIGTETNGSIVCPANANGVVGMKPTVGLWSRSGIIPISHTTDSAGPMTRTVADAAALLGPLARIDPGDLFTAAAGAHVRDDYTQYLDADGLKGRRIGLWTEPLGSHYRVDAMTHQAVAALEEAGAEVIEIEQISSRNINAESLTVLLHEFRFGLDQYFASLGEDAALADFDDLVARVREEPAEIARFDRSLIFRAAETEGLESEEYREALSTMLEFSREQGIDRVMDEHELDAIVAPTGSPAWMTDLTLGDNFSVSSSSPSARAGYPIISVPMGLIDGLPLGISFFGRAWSEPDLLAMAYAYEQATGHRSSPELSAD